MRKSHPSPKDLKDLSLFVIPTCRHILNAIIAYLNAHPGFYRSYSGLYPIYDSTVEYFQSHFNITLTKRLKDYIDYLEFLRHNSNKLDIPVHIIHCDINNIPPPTIPEITVPRKLSDYPAISPE